MMLLAVTVVSLLVQIYSQGYMAGDSGYGRYFAFMSLFTASMLGLVIASNFFQLFVFWELVGLCSYLLIGFWYHKPEAAAAAKKAFLITRIGDFGFLIAILILFNQTGTFDFHEIEQAAKAGVLAVGLLTLVMVLVFSGAVGKSAQFPLHVWLPDAMEGPTPVSALIHAATMVAAGVYLVARLFELFSAAPDAMLVVASIGAFTALFAASHALVARDIKRVLAYSTVSQLGYMMLGLGVGAFSAGTLHLLNHAAFKALLFLAAGSVIHSAGEQDLFKLGRLAGKMKVTAITFLIGGLALAGVPPLSGFWSKDEILTATLQSGHWLLFLVAMLTTALTAFYISPGLATGLLGRRAWNRRGSLQLSRTRVAGGDDGTADSAGGPQRPGRLSRFAPRRKRVRAVHPRRRPPRYQRRRDGRLNYPCAHRDRTRVASLRPHFDGRGRVDREVRASTQASDPQVLR